MMESATIKGLATRLCFWTGREKQIGRAYGAPRQPSTLPGIIKARRICCCSQPATSYLSPSARCAPVNGLAGCYVSTIGKPHEYFDLTSTAPALDPTGLVLPHSCSASSSSSSGNPPSHSLACSLRVAASWKNCKSSSVFRENRRHSPFLTGFTPSDSLIPCFQNSTSPSDETEQAGYRGPIIINAITTGTQPVQRATHRGKFLHRRRPVPKLGPFEIGHKSAA